MDLDWIGLSKFPFRLEQRNQLSSLLPCLIKKMEDNHLKTAIVAIQKPFKLLGVQKVRFPSPTFEVIKLRSSKSVGSVSYRAEILA
jgi:hypothetical protein